jgi:hypothetical protein
MSGLKEIKQFSAKENKTEKIPYKKWCKKRGWIIVGYLNKEENGTK